VSPGERIRSLWEGGDHEALVAACDPGVEWDLTRFEGWGGDAVQSGHDGVRAVLRELGWQGPGTCVASGERVLIDVHADASSAVVHELGDDGRIVRMTSVTDAWEAQLALTGNDPLAIVRAIWSLWEARDMDRVLACFADDVVFDLSHYEAWRGAPRYEGPTSMIAFLAEWMSWWHGYRQEVLGDELHGRDVLLSVRHGGDRDGTRIEETGGLVYDVRHDGIVDRWTVFSSPEKAREWLALRKAPAEAK
jgi:ketosteroid isomerase-like protein